MAPGVEDKLHQVTSKLFPVGTGFSAYLVVSTIALELAPKGRNRGVNRHNRPSMLGHAVPEILNAFRSSGFDAAHQAAKRFETDPQSIWLSKSREEFLDVLSSIYSLLRAKRQIDGFDHGTCGDLVWINLWLD